MALPDGVKEPIAEAGERVLSWVRTSGQRAWIAADGTEVRAPIWAVATASRLWLVASGPEGRWVVAVGDPSVVHLEPGWTQDTLVVGRFRLGVPRPRRSATEQVVAAFRNAGGGGPPVIPEPVAGAEGRAPMAEAAFGVPDWVATHVPADPDERWLHATRTRERHPFCTDRGEIERGRVFVASTDRRTVLTAWAPGHRPWVQEVAALTAEGHRLHAGPRELRGATETAVVTALAGADRAERWRVVIEAAMARGDARGALQLMAEAHERGAVVGWPMLARVLLAVGRPGLAVAAARRGIDQAPDRTSEAVSMPHDRDVRELERQHVDVHVVRALAAEPLGELEPATQTATLPWPPMSLREVWAAAWAPLDPGEALALWQAAPPGERRHRAVATLLELASEPGAGDAWERAALEQRKRNRALAAATLDRALEVAPTPARLWLRGAWAFEDGRSAEADKAWARALDLDPSGTFAVPGSAAQERAIAQVAEAHQAWRAAAGFLRRAVAAAPDDRSAWSRLAEVLADRLAQPAEAAAALGSLLEHPSEGDDTDGPVLLRQARYRLAAGDEAGAQAALRAAVEQDFLHAEVWRGAVELAPQVGLEASWWEHVRRVLTAEEPGPGRPPVDRLPAEALDALHPGGIGFVERMRQAMDTSAPPPRAELVRGLERVTATAFPEVGEAIADLSKRLEIEPPQAYLFRGEGAWGCSAWATKPPVLLIGADHLRPGPRALGRDALRFLIGVELVHLSCDHPVLTFDTNLLGASQSVYRAFGRFAGTAEDVVNLVTLLPGVDQLAKLQRVILVSRRVFAARTAMDKASGVAGSVLEWLGLAPREGQLAGVGREGLDGAGLAFRMQADRAALLLTGDLAAATDAVLKASSQSAGVAERVRERGLAAVLGESGPPPEALRLAALVSYAATLQEAAKHR